MRAFLTALALTGMTLAPIFAGPPPGQPNLILILTDDVGLGDIHCAGGPLRTPNIDTLAAGGMRFEYCYSTPLCGPSRCQLLTGRYPFRTGLINNQSHNAVARETMIPTVMKRAGYVTASVGKWGQICFGPGEWGFETRRPFQTHQPGRTLRPESGSVQGNPHPAGDRVAGSLGRAESSANHPRPAPHREGRQG
jgi:arylsulfatase A